MNGATLSEAKQALFDRLVAGGSPLPAVRRMAERSHFPASWAQKRVWVLEQMHPGVGLFNSQVTLRLDGPLDAGRLKDALRLVVSRHEALRTSFRWTAESLLQVVAPEIALDVPVIRCEESAVGELLRVAIREPFDLERGPLIRARLFRTASETHYFVAVIHHSVFDGWSAEVFLEELSRAFAAEPLPPLPVQYGDWAVWQHERVTAARERHVDWWRERLAGASPVTTFPSDRPRPAVLDDDGALFHARIGSAAAARLRDLSRSRGTTLFMTLLSGFDALLSRYSGERNLVVGSPVAGRLVPESEPLVGLFVNTLPIRVSLEDDPSFAALLERVRRSTADALGHQELPFEVLIDALSPDRSLAYAPYCQLLFQLRSFPRSDQQLPGLDVTRMRIDPGTAKADLMLEVRDDGETLECVYEYNTGLYRQGTVEQIARHYEALLEGAVANPDLPVSRLPILDRPELDRAVFEWNRTACDHRAGETVNALFAEVATRYPDATAIVDGNRCVSYRELGHSASQLADALCRLGVPRGSAVLIRIERSIDAVTAAVGILAAGCVYVPVDPAWPQARVSQLAEQCGATAVVSSGLRIDLLEGGRSPEAPADRLPTPDDPVYIMYTSGSTGEPKGIVTPHRGVTRLVINTNFIRFSAGDVVAMASSFAFDGATFEIWGALLNGATLAVLTREELLDTRLLRDAVERYRINVAFLTTSLFRLHVSNDPAVFRGIRDLVIGGEAVDAGSVAPVFARGPVNLINGYGPTEATTFGLTHRITADDAERGVIPIGRPIANSTAYVLDEACQPQPPGVTGELYLGGPGVALGYVGRPDLTAERFVASPFVAGETLYRTGDLARYRQDGVIEYLGRNDDQVKLRGFRIEPAEIESALRQHPDVVNAVVLPILAAGQTRLAAWVVAASETTPTADLRSFLALRLPDFMIPASVTFIDAIPLSPNGKVDRTALPLPDGEAVPPDAMAPRDEMDHVVADALAASLGRRSVGIDEDFFDAGGDSLSAVLLIAHLEKLTGRRVPVELFFRQPTVRAIADCLREEIEGSFPDYFVTLDETGEGIPLFLVPGGDGTETKVLGYEPLARELAGTRPIHGLYFVPEIHGACTSVEDLASVYRERIEAAHPGPWVLAGHCIGGVIAWEIARQLRERGGDVAGVALLETQRPDRRRRGKDGRRNLASRLARLRWRATHHLQLVRGLPVLQGLRHLLGRAVLLHRWLPFLRARAEPRADRLDSTHYTRLAAAYCPKRAEWPVGLIVSEEAKWPAEMLAWRELAPRLHLVRVPGDHLSHIREHAAASAVALARCIREFERDRERA